MDLIGMQAEEGDWKPIVITVPERSRSPESSIGRFLKKIHKAEEGDWKPIVITVPERSRSPESSIGRFLKKIHKTKLETDETKQSKLEGDGQDEVAKKRKREADLEGRRDVDEVLEDLNSRELAGRSAA